MRSGGYALSGYDPYANLSARDAFAEKRGNCLTYTSLFISFARELGFEASYQLVDVPPDYDSVNGMVVLNKHVNARVDRVPGRGSVTVEFSEEFASGIHDRRIVDDDAFALALHYNNLAFSDDMAGDERGAFVYLKKAIELTPRNPDLWTNLGVFHARRGRFDHAISGYRQALDLDGLPRGGHTRTWQTPTARSGGMDERAFLPAAHGVLPGAGCLHLLHRWRNAPTRLNGQRSPWNCCPKPFGCIAAIHRFLQA